MPTSPFRDWQARCGLTDRKAAEALGVSLGTINALRGTRGSTRAPSALDMRTAYACAAIEAGLNPTCPEWADRRTVLALAAVRRRIPPLSTT